MKFLRISGDASSSSGANNSSLICGTFSCSECISNIDCLWCSSKSSCLNINEDDDSCNSQDVTLTCESNDYLLIVVVVISTISMISLCLLLWYWHYSGSRDNQNQTSINSRPTRDEVWKKDDSKPDWFCIICGGDNKLNASSCLLCGTSKDFTIEYKEQRRLWIKELISTNTGSQIADESEYEIQSLSKISLQQVADASLGITMEERLKAFNYRRINQLSLRQKSARRRKFWQRVLDKQSGRIEWVRVPTNQVKIGDGPLGYKSQESFFQPLLEPLIENDDVEWKDTLTSQLLAAHSVRSSSRLEGSALMSASPAYVHVIDADGQLRWQEVDDQRLSTSPGSDSMRIHEDLINVASYPFNEKQYWFVTRTAKLQKQPMEGLISIEVERSRVLEMSFIALMNAEPEDLHKYFRISFRGEPGLDAGGLSREWYSLVITGLFDPNLGLFTSTGGSESLGGYHINPLSGSILVNHLNYYRFAGRMIGKAVLEQQSIPASLSLPIRKQILGLPVSLSDLEFVDVELFKSLLWLKSCSVNEVESLDLDFTVTYESGKRNGGNPGQVKMVQQDLVPEGASKTVTAENRNEYLMLMLKHRILDSVAPQLTSFLHGINEMIPLIMLQVFDYQELDLLICGVPSISVDDWQEFTEYLGEFRQQGPKHKVIKWFWECVTEFDNEERTRLLQFVTGCSRLPALGFRALQASDGYYRLFNIQSIDKKDSIMPRAHTCFSKLDLPMYDSKTEMQIYLSLVINLEISGGFSLE